jgi:phosphoribosylformylglycinamidine cyclo-ligase
MAGSRDAGVLPAGELAAFGSALEVLRRTFAYPHRGRPATGFGLYASVLDIGEGRGLAISTDGVGTKLLVAQELGRYDTVGIDCVAMNANDIACVGAEPIAMVDYVALEDATTDQLRQLAVGLAEGARRAHISIPGGETAQVPEMLHASTAGDAFDLVGTCVGLVDLDRIVTGSRVAPGDALVGFASTGIHSNGLTLARRVLHDRAGLAYDQHVEDFGRTLGEELLEPTAIYVDLAMRLLAEADVRALFHITGDGLLNLRRAEAPIGFDLEFMPAPGAVFELIQRVGELDAAEMYRVFNMGVGFCAVVPESDVARALDSGRGLGIPGWRLGHAAASPDRRVRVLPLGIESAGERFAALG